MADPFGRHPEFEHVRWSRRPNLIAPVVIAGFSGWSDAGDAASGAVQFLAESLQAEPFATLDPEPFYDFTSTRPRVEFDEVGERQVIWPEIEFAAASVPDQDLDVILLSGPEPQLRWRTFCEQVIGVARLFDANRLLTFGALLAEVPHARPVSMFGIGHPDADAAALHLLPSSYEGPTGITGVIQTSGRDAGMRAASLWATVPTYVPSAPSPKAMLALVERAAQILGASLDLAPLRDGAREYEEEVSSLVDEDDETRDYVRSLEARYDADEPAFFQDSESLIEEVERFLRDQD